jgi:hypothetical protein
MVKPVCHTRMACPLLLLLGASACRAPSVSPSPDPVAQAVSADMPGNTPDNQPSLCSAAVVSDVPALAVNYIQYAYVNVSACAIDGYFDADYAYDGLCDDATNQFIPWIQHFLGCPEAPQEVPGCPATPHAGAPPPFFGLVPESHPPYTITATDFAEIVNTFLVSLTRETGCLLGFTQPQIARMNAMLYQYAPFVINDFDPDAGLTHVDPPGLNCGGYGYYGALNVVAACSPFNIEAACNACGPPGNPPGVVPGVCCPQ